MLTGLMAVEIERKFLVSGNFPQDPSAKTLVQGYIAREDGRSVRIRFDGKAYTLTIKGKSSGFARHEFEWTIDPVQGEELLNTLCGSKVEKERHHVPFAGLLWEIDVFAGSNQGLIVAEVELASVDAAFDLPPWAGREVSEDPRFFNAALLDVPFASWGVTYADLLNPERDIL